jgi:hypothetical protein
MRFVELVADVAGVDADIVVHVAGWLVGRARWSATFVQTWLEVAAKVEAVVFEHLTINYRSYHCPRRRG